MLTVNVYGGTTLGVPAAPVGLSSQATEPMVSALRVSIPDACTLARAGGNRRHACGDTAHEAKAGCHRHGCAVATAPLIKAWRCTQRRFAGRIGSRLLCSPIRLRTSVAEPPLRRHVGQPGKSAQVTPNRLRRTQATVAVLAFGSALAAPLAHFCHALCPRLNARQIVAARVRRLRTDVNHKRKGKTMSTTNNQSIRQINTAALRGTREAHQPDEIKRASNRKAMEFLERQAVSTDSSAFQAGRFFGSCEALCMASVITATQWQELDELRNKNSTSTNKI